MNAEMDISKNQWRSTGGKVGSNKFGFVVLIANKHLFKDRERRHH